jgi:hypothetical protein
MPNYLNDALRFHGLTIHSCILWNYFQITTLSSVEAFQKFMSLLQSLTSRRPLPNHSFLIEKMQNVGNPYVLESIKKSMMRRFGSCGSLASVVLKETKPEPRNALRREHFGCETVLVCDKQSFTRCITFISSQEYLSLDTENTTPRYGISLLQIGSTTNVLIFRVDHSFQIYSKSLGQSLKGKQLLCWGADV